MKSFFRHARHEQDGQVILMVAFLLVVLLGAAGFAIDIGFALHAQRELQASADAAATAGAMDLPASTAVTTANSYSGIPGGKNAYADLPNVTMATGYPMVKCLTSTKLTCDSPANGNAVAVTENATVPTFFSKVFGISSLTVTVTSLASMRTGVPSFANILLVMDTTASMSSVDNQCTIPGLSNPDRLDCAKDGVRTLLNALWPCSDSLASCGAAINGNVANPLQEVGMLVFPGITSSTYASYDYTNCQANDISNYIASYSATTIYSIIPLSSNYRTSTTSGLNGGSSNLVKAVDWQHGVGCTSSSYGLQSPGGMGTYFAGAITAAQAMLDALPSSRQNMQDAIIILSDGDASSSNISASLKKNQCSQAVAAAHTAAAAGTSVYSIAYGAMNAGCSTDGGAYTPCTTMRQIASSLNAIPDASKFYSDNDNGCASASHPSMSSLSQILQQISYDFLTTRLLPFATL